jgi:hypothetical protein
VARHVPTNEDAHRGRLLDVAVFVGQRLLAAEGGEKARHLLYAIERLAQPQGEQLELAFGKISVSGLQLTQRLHDGHELFVSGQ